MQRPLFAMFSFKKDEASADAVQTSGQKSGQTSGVLGRLRQRLKRTRSTLTEGLARLVLGQKVIDAELLEEIEAQLLMADVGVEATQQIISISPPGYSARC